MASNSEDRAGRPSFREPWRLAVVAEPTPDGADTIWTFEWQRWLTNSSCRYGPSIPAKRVNGKVVPV